MNIIEADNLVSVIIPCFNHGKYLPHAIQSILEQNYHNIEIIVVDDGSTDNTKEEALCYSNVKYLYQDNKGLSAARNAGIKISKGSYLIFLDADDWLLPEGIKINIDFLKSNEKLAFVSGGHIKVFENNKIITEAIEIHSDHYQNLLEGNYIGMHGTVMYRRWIFDEFLYDEQLRNCEDYDLYLKITRKFPVLHHTHLIAAYRFHNSNMSGNIPNMLKGVLNVLEKQKSNLKNSKEAKSFAAGKQIWIEYYCKELYKGLLQKNILFDDKVFKTLLKHKPSLLLKYFFKTGWDVKTSNIKVGANL